MNTEEWKLIIFIDPITNSCVKEINAFPIWTTPNMIRSLIIRMNESIEDIGYLYLEVKEELGKEESILTISYAYSINIDNNIDNG